MKHDRVALKTLALRLAATMAGASGESVAAIVALGLVMGTFPVYGCPTVLCLLAALIFRLNAPALQLVNQLSSPVQFVLLIPFARVGEQILGPALAGGWWSHVVALAFQAIVGWACVTVPMGVALYLVLAHIYRRGPDFWRRFENLG